MKKIIHWMYEEIFFIYDGIIYDTIDGCRKQYVFSNELWLLSVLSFTYRGIIYRQFNDPVNGKSKIDVINGFD